MEINAKPPISAANSENLKKPDGKEARKDKKTEDAAPQTSSSQEPDYRVNLSKESLSAAAKLDVDEKNPGAVADESDGEQENALQKLSAAAGQQLAGSNNGMTTASTQKKFETFI